MKYSDIFENADPADIQRAVAFLNDAIEEEESFLQGLDEDDEEYNPEVIWALQGVIEQVKAGKVTTRADLEKIGRDIYEATRAGGMYGDTDHSDNIQHTLADILKIK